MYLLQWSPQDRFSGIMIIFVGETTTLIIYRGELKCPFDSEKERPQGLFWMLEELFVRHSLNDPTLLFDFSLFKKYDLFTNFEQIRNFEHIIRPIVLP